jgi:hypothetical protein
MVNARIPAHYRSVFLRHGVHQTLGLAVLHRHFDLETGEKLVEYNAVTAPWRMPDSLKIIRGKVFPKSWVFGEDEELYPYEFGYDPYIGGDTDGGRGGGFAAVNFSHAFVSEMRDLLKTYGLMRTYGVCLIEERVWDPSMPRLLEFTAGRTSVVVPLAVSEEETKSVVESTWVFPCVASVEGEEARLKICAKECYGHKEGV